MNSMFLQIALWTTILLTGLSILGMAIAGLRSVWYGKVNLLTIGIVALPGVAMLVLGPALGSWARAGVYTLALLFALLIFGMLGTGLRQVLRSAFR